MHVAGVDADPATFEHIEPDDRRQPPRAARLRAVGQGHGASRAPRDAGHRARRRRRRARGRAGQGARARAATTTRPPTAPSSCCCARRPGDYEPLFRLESLAGDRREARRRPGRDRGDDQDLGRRGALRAHRRGQRPGQRPGPGAARRRWSRSIPTCATSSWSTSRSASSTRPRAPTRSPGCCSTPPTATTVWGSIGVSENVIEASWEALRRLARVRHAAGEPRRASAGAAAAPRARDRDRPARSRSPGRCSAQAEEERRAGGAALRPAVARAACWRQFEQRLRRAGSGAGHASAVSSGTAGLHLALRAVGVERRR